MRDVLITSGERRLNELSLFNPARHPLRGDLIAVHKYVNRANSREELLKLKEDTGTGANRAKAEGKKCRLEISSIFVTIRAKRGWKRHPTGPEWAKVNACRRQPVQSMKRLLCWMHSEQQSPTPAMFSVQARH